jgi:hypothetical protein
MTLDYFVAASLSASEQILVFASHFNEAACFLCETACGGQEFHFDTHATLRCAPPPLQITEREPCCFSVSRLAPAASREKNRTFQDNDDSFCPAFHCQRDATQTAFALNSNATALTF